MAKLDKQAVRRITAFLRERVAAPDDPRGIGEALKGSPVWGNSGNIASAITGSSAASRTAFFESSSWKSATAAKCIDRESRIDRQKRGAHRR
jgi:hypothetical protein